MEHIIRMIVASMADQDGQAPGKVLLFRKGWNELETGERFFVDQESYDLIRIHWSKRGIDIVFDYEHQTILNVQAPAAGWIKPSALSWDETLGIVADVTWTETAAGYISRKEYRYFSPVFMVRKSDSKLVGLHSVALTNTPKTNELQAIAAKLGTNINPTKEEDMEFFKALFAKLGLAEGASVQDVMAAIDGFIAKAKTTTEVVTKDVLQALGLSEGSDTTTVVASILALKQAPAGMVSRQEFDTIKAKLDDRDVQDAMNKWARKMTPATRDSWLVMAKKDLVAFEAHMAKMPDVIPTGDLPRQEDPSAAVVDDVTLSVAKAFGVTADDIKKYGGA